MNDISLTATPLYAGILALLYVALAFHVIQGRWKSRIGLGAGGDAGMLTRIRMHGNFAEYVPFCLLLMLLAELGGAAAIWLHALGMALVLGRLAHAVGLSRTDGASVWRAFGMAATFGVLIVGGLLAIGQALTL